MPDSLYLPLKEYIQKIWPSGLINLPPLDGMNDVWMEPLNTRLEAGFQAHSGILIKKEMVIGIPGVDAITLVFRPVPGDEAVMFSVVTEPSPQMRIDSAPLVLRLQKALLQPARRAPSSGDGTIRIEADPTRDQLEIALDRLTLALDFNGGLELQGPAGFDLPLCIVANSGIGIEAKDVRFYGRQDTPPPGQPAGWRGLHMARASLYLPGELGDLVGALELTDASIGNGGFTGSVSETWTPPRAAQFFGLDLTLKSVSLSFVQNALTGGEIHGTLKLPFFDEALDVVIGPQLGGGFLIRLDSPTGLLTLHKPGILDLEVESLAFAVQGDLFVVKLSGKITPRFGGLDSPTIEVTDLSIDSHGNVRLEGGWLDLASQCSLDFYGFSLEITRLGFGKTDDGGKWVGFSGGLHLVEGLPAGASVEGLRVIWHDGGGVKITLNGVGVEFEIPGVLSFKGAVSYNELTSGAETIHRFDGSIRLTLTCIGLEVDGTLVIGTDSGPDGQFSFFAIYIDVELPAGIPLFATGLGLYGLAGLFALQMAPNKGAAPNVLHPTSRTDESWYENPDGSPGWYKRPTVGVTDLKSKWDPKRGGLALGAGITIGTLPDNGFLVNGRLLLAISFPGPVLLLEGRANILKERAHLEDDPIFRALAVLDFNAGTFLIGLDAYLKYFGGGELIDIHAGAEAFYSFSDAGAWHLYLGEKDPREKRIRASTIFHLFESDAYLMLDAKQVAFGARVGYDAHWSFGPLSVTMEAWIEGNAVVSWKPAHLHGDLWFHGKIALKVFGFGLGLGLDARVAADVFDPFHLLGELSVSISLPWPLPDVSADITLEWPSEGGDKKPPSLPTPIKEVAIEHFKVTTRWPIPAGTDLLTPAYDRGDGFLALPAPLPAPAAPPPADAPVVPPDCRPHITFGRPVHDDALVGVNPQPVVPDRERLGDPTLNQGPATVRYGLKEVSLHRWQGGAWVLTARKAGPTDTPNPAGVPELYGSWAPMPQMPSGGGKFTAQTKLWLWSKTPFDYTLHTSGAWDKWFTGVFTDYPCVPIRDRQETCCDFHGLKSASLPVSPWRCPDHPGMIFSWEPPTQPSVLSGTLNGQPFQVLCLSVSPDAPDELGVLTVDLPGPADSVRILLLSAGDTQAVGIGPEGQVYGPFSPTRSGGDLEVLVTGSGPGSLTRVLITGNSRTCVLQVCALTGTDPAAAADIQQMMQHLRDSMALWSQTGEVLQPHVDYRLTIVTTVDALGEGDLAGFSAKPAQTQFAYFRTGEPPGLAPLSVPIGQQNPTEFRSGLEDLTRYIRQTVPPTVPAVGERPPLPRPVYRAYDVGVEFNEDYVDLLYRLDRRDLGVYLFDSSNQPARDARGRLIAMINRWGKTEALTLTESEKTWIKVVNGSACASLDPSVIPRDSTLGAPPQVLDPAIVYEARLIPLLLHDDFSQGIGGWQVQDEGTNGAPSAWAAVTGGAAGAFLQQTSAIWGGSADGTDPVKPGSLLILGPNAFRPAGHPDQPPNWSDYRASVYFRSSSDGAVGLLFRFQDAGHTYRISLDRKRHYRRLVRIAGGVHTILAEDDGIYRSNVDTLLTVEAIGASLKVYVDGEVIFDAVDASLSHGGIALYCWMNGGLQFRDVRVEDFRAQAPVAYRFRFTTSQFADFFHHLHSFKDETWPAALPGGVDLPALAASASPPGSPPTVAEARSYDTIASAILGQAERQNPPEVQITRLEREGNAAAFLVRGPEPVDWKRTHFELAYAARHAPPVQAPLTLKLTDLTPGAALPNEESITLLLEDASDLSGCSIEQYHLPGPVESPAGDPILFADNFRDAGEGVLFTETFGPNALDHYTIISQGTALGPAAWSSAGGEILQTSSLFGGDIDPAVPDKPGTMAVTGAAAWRNYRLRVTLRSDVWGSIGVVFRFQDEKNYYRISFGQQWFHYPAFHIVCYRRLIKVAAGVVTVLWEDARALNGGQDYEVEIQAADADLVGHLDGEFLFHVQDRDLQAGKIGLYTWKDPGAHFKAIAVEALALPLVLWEPAFNDLLPWTVVDGVGTIEGPSQWAAAAGVVTQSSTIHLFQFGEPADEGTYLYGGDPDWDDVEISVLLQSGAPGAVGLIFRYQDDDNYYRFSMDQEHFFYPHLVKPYRRLIKKVAGVVMVLWQDNAAYTLDQEYRFTVRAVGSELTGILDDVTLFSVFDGDLGAGRVGLYSWANPGARFRNLLVLDRARRVGFWKIHDEGATNAPSNWKMGGGAFRQSSAISGGAPPANPGTQAATGSTSWNDIRMAVTVRSEDAGGSIGAVCRYRDSQNYYRFSLEQGARRFVRKLGGIVTVLWQDSVGALPGEEYRITLDAIGDRLSGYVDEDALFTISDAGISEGSAGLYCAANPGARFQSFEVRHPPLEAYALLRDGFMEGSLAGWSVVDEGNQNIPSAWTAAAGILRQGKDIFTSPDLNRLDKRGTELVGGDPSWTNIVLRSRVCPDSAGAPGLLFRYTDKDNYYRLTFETNLLPGPGPAFRPALRLVKRLAGTASLLWEGEFHYKAGQWYELTVVMMGSLLRGYVDGVPAFTVRDPDLVGGQIALYTWQTSGAQFTGVRVFPAERVFQDWLLEDPFFVLKDQRWSFVDETAQGGASHWDVAEQGLDQSGATGQTTADASMPGTLALAGDLTWTDYRLTVRLRSGSVGAIGAVIRYVDAATYYRFSMDRDGGYRRLVRNVGGVLTVLWQDATPFLDWETQTLTLDCVGDRLEGWLNGEAMFSLDDDAIPAGQIGLYCCKNTDAHFDEARVAAASWRSFYSFGDEARLPAGTRCRIFSGRSADAHAHEPNVQLRFESALNQPGQIRLDTGMARLRVLSALKQTLHERAFLSSSNYSPAAVRLLRKADGTGFVIVPDPPAAGSQFSPGEYRMKLVYHRDNSAADPGSQILSESGDRGPETVTLDIPGRLRVNPSG